MAEYQVSIRHLDSWRGVHNHKWTTDYPYVGTLGGISDATLTAFAEQEAEICYNGTNGEGFIDSIALYDLSAKGSPLVELSGLAMAYTGGAWTAAENLKAQELQREVSLLIEWAGGMSRTGKPVTFKKYIHAVPAGLAAAPEDEDVAGGNKTGIEAAAEFFVTALAGSGLAMGNARRFAGDTPTAAPYLVNHQMPRGRKRKS